MEQWQTIKNFSKYEVSTLGRIRNKKTLRILKLRDKGGYSIVDLRTDDKLRKTVRVHRAAMMTFFPIDDAETKHVDHIDGVRNNNKIENLRWSDAMTNISNKIENRDSLLRLLQELVETHGYKKTELLLKELL